MPTKVFSAYSHEDEDLRNNLEVHLSMLKREGLIESWHDRRITAGSDLDQTIDAKLEEAKIVLLLVSPDFLASKYCYDVEMKRALELHKSGKVRVIPVILRPCDWHSTPFGNLLAVPRDGEPVTKWQNTDEAFLDIAKSIRKVIEEMDVAGSASASPKPVSEPSFHEASESIGPYSDNLRMPNTFTQYDKDYFLQESFEYITEFFKNSLAKLREQNPKVKYQFKRLGSQQFSAVLYRDGQDLSRCLIFYEGSHSLTNGIAYSYNDFGNVKSYNELLSVVETDQALFLKPLGMSTFSYSGNSEDYLDMKGAAEMYWGLFIRRLQQ